jgi:hypothetical protein
MKYYLSDRGVFNKLRHPVEAEEGIMLALAVRDFEIWVVYDENFGTFWGLDVKQMLVGWCVWKKVQDWDF